MGAVNTLDVALARRARHAEWMREVAEIDAQENPKPKKPTEPAVKRTPGRPAVHGNFRAYLRHVKAGEKPCPPCEAAHQLRNKKNRERAARRKELELTHG